MVIALVALATSVLFFGSSFVKAPADTGATFSCVDRSSKVGTADKSCNRGNEIGAIARNGLQASDSASFGSSGEDDALDPPQEHSPADTYPKFGGFGTASYSAFDYRANRPRYMSLADRCSAGLIDAGLHCNAGIRLVDRAEDEAGAVAPHSISGRVLNSRGVGISGVTVIASPARENGRGRQKLVPRYRTVSDPTGLYIFRGLPEGDYMVRNNAFRRYPSVRIAVHTGVRYADLVLPEKNAFYIEGEVVASTGEPLERVTVLPIVLGMPSVTTDASGRYRLPVMLQPGVPSVRLRFQLSGFRDTYASVANPQVETGLSQVVDAVMEPIEYTTSVTGTVSTDDGSPLSRRMVELRPFGEQKL